MQKCYIYLFVSKGYLKDKQGLSFSLFLSFSTPSFIVGVVESVLALHKLVTLARQSSGGEGMTSVPPWNRDPWWCAVNREVSSWCVCWSFLFVRVFFFLLMLFFVLFFSYYRALFIFMFVAFFLSSPWAINSSIWTMLPLPVFLLFLFWMALFVFHSSFSQLSNFLRSLSEGLHSCAVSAGLGSQTAEPLRLWPAKWRQEVNSTFLVLVKNKWFGMKQSAIASFL